MLSARRLEAGDLPAIAVIIRGLPDYFTDEASGQVEADAVSHGGWVVTDAGGITGFAVVARKSARAAEILWMAVHHARRGRGAGSVLLGHVLDDLAAAGIAVVEAKTLDRSAGYQPYEATRAFWERKGFVQIDTIDPLPGWEPGNPAAIYVAALGSPRGRRTLGQAWRNRAS